MTKTLTPLNFAPGGNTFFEQANLVNQLVAALANEILTSNSIAGGAMSSGNGFNIGIFGSNTIAATIIRGGNVTTSNTLWLGANLNANGWTITAGNVTVNSTTFAVGNSTVYSQSNNLVIKIIDTGQNAVINTTSVSLGNSTANLFVNTSVFSLGNTSANATINSAGFFFDGVSLAATLPSFSNTTTGAGTFTVDTFPITQYRAAEYAIQATDNANANNYQFSKVHIVHNGAGAFVTEYALMITNTAVGTWSATTNSSAVILQWTTSSGNTTVKGTKNLIAL